MGILCFSLFPAFIGASTAAAAAMILYRWYTHGQNTQERDRASTLLVLLLGLAIVSMGAFLSYLLFFGAGC
jgi:hypothetical protein